MANAAGQDFGGVGDFSIPTEFGDVRFSGVSQTGVVGITDLSQFQNIITDFQMHLCFYKESYY